MKVNNAKGRIERSDSEHCVAEQVFWVDMLHALHLQNYWRNTGLFISPSGISELDCATTKTDTAERSISIVENLSKFFFY